MPLKILWKNSDTDIQKDILDEWEQNKLKLGAST